MLTQREKEIMTLVYEGASAKEIADRLFISEHTVKTHLKNMRRKWKVTNRVKMIRMAMQCGLIC
jgi:LuxR family transcriptional regulator, positive regulator of biofilm formation